MTTLVPWQITFALPRTLFLPTGPVTERLRVREIDADEDRRLMRIVRRGTDSGVTWRRAQMVLSAQRIDAAAIARVTIMMTGMTA